MSRDLWVACYCYGLKGVQVIEYEGVQFVFAMKLLYVT